MSSSGTRGLKDGEHFLTSHVVEDLPDAVRRSERASRRVSHCFRAADYAYTVLDPEFISEYWHALLAGYAGLFDWDDPELALAPAMCARQPRMQWLNQAEHVCFRGARLGRCYMKLMGTTRDQDFVPIPSMQSMAEQCATTAGMQDLYPQLRERSARALCWRRQRQRGCAQRAFRRGRRAASRSLPRRARGWGWGRTG